MTRHGPVTVAVLGGGDPRRAMAVRDAIASWLAATPAAAPPAAAGGPRGTGRVALVGGGPGDPELITVKGRRLLAAADVVVADRLAPGLLLDELRPEVELIDAAKIPYGPARAQEEINRILVDRARAGQFVVRLKGGDPFVFGRGGEEVLACAEAGVPVTVVPGVTSAIAAPGGGRHPGHPPRGRARVHRRLRPPAARTTRSRWWTGRRWPGCAARSCVLMGLKNLPAIAATLHRARPDGDTPAAVVQEGTTRGAAGSSASTLAPSPPATAAAAASGRRRWSARRRRARHRRRPSGRPCTTVRQRPASAQRIRPRWL